MASFAHKQFCNARPDEEPSHSQLHLNHTFIQKYQGRNRSWTCMDWQKLFEDRQIRDTQWMNKNFLGMDISRNQTGGNYWGQKNQAHAQTETWHIGWTGGITKSHNYVGLTILITDPLLVGTFGHLKLLVRLLKMAFVGKPPYSQH